jgi:Domain of unknown function (DUF6378)
MDKYIKTAVNVKADLEETKIKEELIRLGYKPPAPEVSTSKEIPFLHQAHNIITGDRQRDYGDKLPNFQQIADLWNATLKFKLSQDAQITAEDVALCMIQVKVARLAKMPEHFDSILDVAGYAGCYDAIRKEKELLSTSTVEPLDVRAALNKLTIYK